MRELSIDELCRLQQLVIENERFLKLGLRTSGGFVGEHDRFSGEPLPDHISAKPEDLKRLMNGLIETSQLLTKDPIDAVVAATKIAFGFVYIHPFVDGLACCVKWHVSCPTVPLGVNKYATLWILQK